ncbi:DUF563 domain-containing protein [Roseomonas terrae]|uniref:DUF563 domain-containing protein n=1 Tax=Neoroseomonas terrae TaxID=424799 RepID=A0ABS5EFY7_9PROT|nr:DUF563 domain-containing protein [Neoroseomonas terrae]
MTAPGRFDARVAAFHRALLLPVERLASGGAPFRVGALDQNGLPIKEFRLRRGRSTTADATFQHPTEILEGEYVYGGISFAQWGHFLLETLARLWFLKACSDHLPIIWHGVDGHAGFWRWQAELINIVGLGGREHRFVVSPTQISNLTVPEPGFVLLDEFAERQVRALGCVSFGAKRRGHRVWISRSQLKARTIAGEADVEARLLERGWAVLSPEKLSVREQLTMIAGAEVIAGFEGSAFHTLALFDDVPSKVRIVARPGGIGANYQLIAAAKSIDQAVFTAQVDAVSVSDRGTTLAARDPARIVEFANDGGAKLPQRAPSPVPGKDRIRALRAEAWRLLGKKARLEADAIAQAVLAEVPLDAGMLRCRAEVALAMRDLPAALELATLAWAQPSATSEHALLLADILLKTNRPADVIDLIASASARLSNAVTLVRPHVEALRRLGRYDEAAAVFDVQDMRALPRSLQLLRALVLVECEREFDAIEALCDLVEGIDPGRADLGGIVNVVDILRQRRAIGRSNERLVRALSRLPPHFRLAWLVAPDAPSPEALDHDDCAVVAVQGQEADPRIAGVFKDWPRHPASSFARNFRPEQDVNLRSYRNVYLYVFESGFILLDRDWNPLDISYPYALPTHVDLIRDRSPVSLGSIFYAGDRFAPRNYCHWISDYLPRILVANDLGVDLKIGIPRYDAKKFQLDSLSFFGIDPHSVHNIANGLYHCEVLKILDSSSHRFQRYFQHGNAKYASALLRRLPRADGLPSKRIWLTRGETKIRHLVNEAEVNQLVEKLGFRAIDAGAMPFAEQVQLMMSAAHVAGPHGAAFQNILFCRERTGVAEFFPANYGTPAFAVMAALRNLRYQPFIVEAAGSVVRLGQERQSADFSADLSSIEAGIRSLLRETAAP